MRTKRRKSGKEESKGRWRRTSRRKCKERKLRSGVQEDGGENECGLGQTRTIIGVSC